MIRSIYAFVYRRRYVGLLLLLIAMALVKLVSRSGDNHDSGFLPTIVLELFGPFQKGLEKGSTFFRNTWKRYIYLVGLEEENRLLREIVEELKQKRVEQIEARLENARLRSLIGFKESVSKPLLPAQVVGKDLTGLFHTLLIDRGKQEGIEEGMAVLAVNGIVGQVMESSGHFSRVLLITDPNSSVAAMVQKSRARGIVEGRGRDACVLKYVHRSENVEQGDLVVTSGLDGVYPKGTMIGVVSQVHKEETELFQDVDIDPSVDFNKLEEVLVVSEKPSPPRVSRENADH